MGAGRGLESRVPKDTLGFPHHRPGEWLDLSLKLHGATDFLLRVSKLFKLKLPLLFAAALSRCVLNAQIQCGGKAMAAMSQLKGHYGMAHLPDAGLQAGR